MSERVAICERIVRQNHRECLCLRASGHNGPCFGFRKHAAEADAFQRGAEAMREAAARLAYAKLAHTLTDVHEKIRALPIPEDES
ncbi:MAG: hypothetical protein RLZ94_774 [Actinomycetota bacterium]